MQNLASIIRETVRQDKLTDTVVDLDAYRQRFSALRPDLDPKDIEHAVLEAVANAGASASWGTSSRRC